MKTWYLLLGIGIISSLLSCSDDDPITGVNIKTVNINNLAADPVIYDPVTGKTSPGTDQFTLFRFSDSSIVSHADSATTKWDIGFKSTTIIVNSKISGPGSASAFIANGLFNELKEVPKDSIFKEDVSATELAIGKAWQSYDPINFIVSPIPGKIIVIKTNDNKFVKMEILSFYKDAPAVPNYQRDPARYYTFRYVIQKDGSKKFE